MEKIKRQVIKKEGEDLFLVLHIKQTFKINSKMVTAGKK